MLTQKFLKSILDYDPETGVFNWKYRAQNCFKTLESCNSWNTRYANTKAGSLNSNGYILIGIKRKKHPAHRLAWLYFYGKIPNKIDHINGKKTDNRIKNLRICTCSENGANTRLQSRNTTGFKGCYQRGETWQSFIGFRNNLLYLGSYETKELAAKAYDEKAIELFGEFAETNKSMGLLS